MPCRAPLSGHRRYTLSQVFPETLLGRPASVAGHRHGGAGVRTRAAGALAIILAAQPVCHLLTFHRRSHRPRICRHPAPARAAGMDHPITRHGGCHDANRARQVCAALLQIAPRPGTTVIAARGGGQDLQQPVPFAPATDGSRFPGAFILGQGRQETHPERPPQRRGRRPIARAPLSDIIRHRSHQRCAVGRKRAERGIGTQGRLCTVIPAGGRNEINHCSRAHQSGSAGLGRVCRRQIRQRQGQQKGNASRPEPAYTAEHFAS